MEKKIYMSEFIDLIKNHKPKDFYYTVNTSGLSMDTQILRNLHNLYDYSKYTDGSEIMCGNFAINIILNIKLNIKGLSSWNRFVEFLIPMLRDMNSKTWPIDGLLNKLTVEKFNKGDYYPKRYSEIVATIIHRMFDKKLYESLRMTFVKMSQVINNVPEEVLDKYISNKKK